MQQVARGKLQAGVKRNEEGCLIHEVGGMRQEARGRIQ